MQNVWSEIYKTDSQESRNIKICTILLCILFTFIYMLFTFIHILFNLFYRLMIVYDFERKMFTDALIPNSWYSQM